MSSMFVSQNKAPGVTSQYHTTKTALVKQVSQCGGGGEGAGSRARDGGTTALRRGRHKQSSKASLH